MCSDEELSYYNYRLIDDAEDVTGEQDPDVVPDGEVVADLSSDEESDNDDDDKEKGGVEEEGGDDRLGNTNTTTLIQHILEMSVTRRPLRSAGHHPHTNYLNLCQSCWCMCVCCANMCEEVYTVLSMIIIYAC